MRYLMLWAGQKILFGLWFLGWPAVIWRWLRRAQYVPHRERKHLRIQCLVGGVIGSGFLAMGISDFDFAWIYEVTIIYAPWGFEALAKANTLARKYARPPSLAGPNEQ